MDLFNMKLKNMKIAESNFLLLKSNIFMWKKNY